jgi:hypothetical protein
MTEAVTRHFPLSNLPHDERGAISTEAINTMLANGQAEELALGGLGWMVRCMDASHHHRQPEGIALVGPDRFVKIGAACSVRTVRNIPVQPAGR